MRKVKGIVNSGAVPIGDEYYGDVAKNYLDHRDHEVFWKKEQLVLEQEIKSINIVGESKRVLDVPFGTGRFGDLYLDNELKVFGLDSSKDMLEVARQRLGEKFSKCNTSLGVSTEMPYDGDYFDLLVCFRFLPWVISYKDVEVSLKEYNRVLKLDGYAFLEFSVNKDENLNHRPRIVNNNSIMWDNFTSDQIIRLLNSHGFNVETERFIFDNVENPNVTLFVCKKN